MRRLNDCTPEEWDNAYEHIVLRMNQEISHAKEKSDGSTANYYKLPEGANELQDLISAKNMNYHVGNIFMLCYNHSIASSFNDVIGQINAIKEIINHAERELRRIETMHKM